MKKFKQFLNENNWYNIDDKLRVLLEEKIKELESKKI